MRINARGTVVAVLALLGSVVLALTSTFTATVAQGATAALIMGGSGLGNPTEINDLGLNIPMPNYMPNVEDYYIAPNSSCQPATCQLVPVITPEGLLPPIIGTTTFDPSVAEGVTDLNAALQTQLKTNPGEQVVIFGYSQSGDIITKTQRNFAADPTTAPSPQQVSFVVTGNTNRPNGGILSRFPGLYIPGLNITFDGAAPTNTGYKTTDIAFEYDPVADFPEYPIDVLADLNALVGFLDVHATYPNPYLPLPSGIPFFPTALPNGYTPAQLKQAMNDPKNRQTYGDTTYITIPAINLPLLQPLLDIGTLTGTSWLTKPIVDLVQPALRVLIDLGYDRTVPYGQPTPVALLPNVNLSTLAANLGTAVSQGIHDALTDLGLASLSPLAPSTATNPSTPVVRQAADVAVAAPRNAKPLPPSRPSSTSAAATSAAASPVASGASQSDSARSDTVTSVTQKRVAARESTVGEPDAAAGATTSARTSAAETTRSKTAVSVATKHGKPTVPSTKATAATGADDCAAAPAAQSRAGYAGSSRPSGRAHARG